MAKKVGQSRPASNGSLTGGEAEALDLSAVPGGIVVDALIAVINSDAFVSISSYDNGRCIRIALQVRGARYDEYCRDVQHLAAALEAVAAKCVGDEPMSRKAGAGSPI